jgi:hypothetical protein
MPKLNHNINYLAYRTYPKPNGKTYHAKDLNNEEKVIQLFDYCQIIEAIITKDGWNFLTSKYGMEKLFSLNQKSGWFDCSTIEEFKEFIVINTVNVPNG